MVPSDGGGIGVDPGQLDAAAGTFRSVSQDVAGTTSSLVDSLASAENGLGDPIASGALGDLIQAWIGPLSLLGPMLDELANSMAGSARVYTTTDAAVARHVQ